MTDSQKTNTDLLNKIKRGLKLAARKLMEEKAANNETAVISVNGEIKSVSAKELLKKMK